MYKNEQRRTYKKSMSKFPQIYRGQKYNIDGELYELIDFKITNVISKKNFTTTAFFKSLEANSKNPLFEEQIKNVINNPFFEIILHYEQISQNYIWHNLSKGDHINIFEIHSKFRMHRIKPTDVFRIVSIRRTNITRQVNYLKVIFKNIKLTTRREITLPFSIIDGKEIYDTTHIKVHLINVLKVE